MLNGPRLISLHPCCSVSINPPTAPAQPETLPLTPPTSQEPWSGGAANAGIAMATIIAAKISASTHTIRARRKVTFMFLSLVLSSIAFRHRVCTRTVCNRIPPSFRLRILSSLGRYRPVLVWVNTAWALLLTTTIHAVDYPLRMLLFRYLRFSLMLLLSCSWLFSLPIRRTLSGEDSQGHECMHSFWS